MPFFTVKLEREVVTTETTEILMEATSQTDALLRAPEEVYEYDPKWEQTGGANYKDARAVSAELSAEDDEAEVAELNEIVNTES